MAQPFIEGDVLPVLYDPMIFRQVLTLIKKNIPNLKGIVLGKNSLRLSHVRVVIGLLKECPLAALNLQDNNIENLPELFKLMKGFPLVELKLTGNRCTQDMKDLLYYFKTARCQFPLLKYLDGQDVDLYLASKQQSSHLSTPSTSTETKNSSHDTSTEQLENEVKTFLSQYFTCFDSEQRLGLTAAYIPDAKMEIQSAQSVIPTGQCYSLSGIEQALRCIPKTKHVTETFSMKIVRLEHAHRDVRVTGQVHIETCPTIVSFVHDFNIVPYNAGFGCANARLCFK